MHSLSLSLSHCCFSFSIFLSVFRGCCCCCFAILIFHMCVCVLFIVSRYFHSRYELFSWQICKRIFQFFSNLKQRQLLYTAYHKSANWYFCWVACSTVRLQHLPACSVRLLSHSCAIAVAIVAFCLTLCLWHCCHCQHCCCWCCSCCCYYCFTCCNCCCCRILHLTVHSRINVVLNCRYGKSFDSLLRGECKSVEKRQRKLSTFIFFNEKHIKRYFNYAYR